MSAIVTTPQISWTAAHRTLLGVIAAILAVAVAAVVVTLLTTRISAVSGTDETFPSGGESSCSLAMSGNPC